MSFWMVASRHHRVFVEVSWKVPGLAPFTPSSVAQDLVQVAFFQRSSPPNLVLSFHQLYS